MQIRQAHEKGKQGFLFLRERSHSSRLSPLRALYENGIRKVDILIIGYMPSLACINNAFRLLFFTKRHNEKIHFEDMPIISIADY
jgi:hypothetical protein